MPRGDPNREIGILQMADNAAAEKSGAAKYGHVSRRHDAKISRRPGLRIIFSALPEAKQASAQARRIRRVTSSDESQACARPSFASGTEGSNPAPSSSESATNRAASGARASMTKDNTGQVRQVMLTPGLLWSGTDVTCGPVHKSTVVAFRP